jgi:hypothetical protein
MIVVVLGLRRSGTSLLAGLLHNDFAISMGETFAAMKKEWNQDGFYEDAQFLAIVDAVMKTCSSHNGVISSVKDPTVVANFVDFIRARCQQYTNWGVKNFGINYFLREFSMHCQEKPHIICMRRTFAEALNSFHARNGGDFPDNLKMFANDLYNLDCTYKTYPGPKLEVSYDALLDNSFDTLSGVANFLHMELPPTCLSKINPEARRFRLTPRSLTAETNYEVKDKTS